MLPLRCSRPRSRSRSRAVSVHRRSPGGALRLRGVDQHPFHDAMLLCCRHGSSREPRCPGRRLRTERRGWRTDGAMRQTRAILPKMPLNGVQRPRSGGGGVDGWASAGRRGRCVLRCSRLTLSARAGASNGSPGGPPPAPQSISHAISTTCIFDPTAGGLGRPASWVFRVEPFQCVTGLRFSGVATTAGQGAFLVQARHRPFTGRKSAVLVE